MRVVELVVRGLSKSLHDSRIAGDASVLHTGQFFAPPRTNDTCRSLAKHCADEPIAAGCVVPVLLPGAIVATAKPDHRSSNRRVFMRTQSSVHHCSCMHGSWMFDGSFTCTLTKCDPVTGTYFDGAGVCSTKDCTNEPKVIRLRVPVL